MVIGRLNFRARVGGTEEENDGMNDRLWMSTLVLRANNEDFRVEGGFAARLVISLGALNLLFTLRPVSGSNDEFVLGLVSIFWENEFIWM